MNTREKAKVQIEEFLKSDEKCMLLTGTNQYEKHKLIMSILNSFLNNKLILFRINAMQNINGNSFLGWSGIKQNPKSGERIKIGKNIYEFDSFNTESTWYRTNKKFACAICYPIDSICREKKLDSIKNLFAYKEISKIFLVSWTDRNDYDYSIFSDYINRHIIYDAEEEDIEYHKRVLEII